MEKAEAAENDVVCSICTDQIDLKKEYVITNPCKHQFCVNCMGDFLAHENANKITKPCPMCRKSISSLEFKNKVIRIGVKQFIVKTDKDKKQKIKGDKLKILEDQRSSVLRKYTARGRVLKNYQDKIRKIESERNDLGNRYHGIGRLIDAEIDSRKLEEKKLIDK